ncbi:DUF4424 family protein [Acinetobacter johnsonii]|uniref:DUF4424 family protein n=1 Tax=Acinetobacter johnsonii TaxID=40214 RepID=UPI002935A30B|nr:DUF4424 family protein [Acinetobacter johnsonii]MDV2489226.1 DUF4424 family protein [Acinetobacter johnsonii]
MKKILGLCVFISMQISANDSTGFVATGGVQYLKNPKISMQSEDLFISKNIIRVNYQFKNLTAQDITETVLFPLPRVGSSRESDFAHTEQLIQSFKVQANAQKIQPETHVRAFLPALTTGGDFNSNGDVVDVTTGLKKCGFSDRDLMYPWLLQQDSTLNQRLYHCQDKTVRQLLKPYQADDEIYWESQIIYSWQQKFKANALTHVQHEYMPLVGGSVSLYPEEDEKIYCMDQNFKAGLKKAKCKRPLNTPYEFFL